MLIWPHAYTRSVLKETLENDIIHKEKKHKRIVNLS